MPVKLYHAPNAAIAANRQMSNATELDCWLMIISTVIRVCINCRTKMAEAFYNLRIVGHR